MSSKKPIKSKYLKNIYNSYCKRVYPPLVTLMCVLIVFFLVAIITREILVFLIFPFLFLGIMAWLLIGFAEVDDYQEDGIELLTKYSKIKKLYKNKSIPSSIKLLLNLNWAFNYEDNDNLDSDDYNTWLDSIIDILTTVKENRDVIPWVLHSIDNAGIDIHKFLSNSMKPLRLLRMVLKNLMIIIVKLLKQEHLKK